MHLHGATHVVRWLLVRASEKYSRRRDPLLLSLQAGLYSSAHVLHVSAFRVYHGFWNSARKIWLCEEIGVHHVAERLLWFRESMVDFPRRGQADEFAWDVCKCDHAFDGASGNGLAGHAVDGTTGLVLSQRTSARGPHREQTSRSVVSHTGQNHTDSVFASSRAGSTCWVPCRPPTTTSGDSSHKANHTNTVF